jgi:ribosomal protein S12 methylthiotransferase accessory factor
MERIAILGTGQLAATIRRHISEIARCELYAELPASADAVVVVANSWNRRGCDLVRVACSGRWLLICQEPGRLVIGPWETSTRRGCHTCLQLRRAFGRLPEPDDTVPWSFADWITEPRIGEHACPAYGVVGKLVAEDLPVSTADLAGEVRFVDSRDARVTRHLVLPDARCPDCADRPEPESSPPGTVLQPRWKSRADDDRVGTVIDVTSVIDPEVGTVRDVVDLEIAGVHVAAAMAGPTGTGFGQSYDRQRARLTAVCEAMERYGAVAAPNRTSVVGSYRELRESAIHPDEFGLYSAAQYQSRGFRYRPFADDQRYRWVWGYSFAQDRRVLVPEYVAYFGSHETDRVGERFVAESSNGCALGTCLEEAILHGILEVIERDAFLLAWYGRRHMVQLDLATAAGEKVAEFAAGITANTGYDVAVFDTTVEGIPCCWATAVNPSHVDGRPKVVCTAGAHLDPQRAVSHALFELIATQAGSITRYAEERERARRMVRDPNLVRRVADHSLLYADPAVFDRFGFVLPAGGPRSFDEVFGRYDLPRMNKNLTEDVLELVRRCRTIGSDVIVVDQTGVEHESVGLVCVKVLIPGTLPMTFGHRYHRLSHLPRRVAAARTAGHALSWSPGDRVHPHPFT